MREKKYTIVAFVIILAVLIGGLFLWQVQKRNTESSISDTEFSDELDWDTDLEFLLEDQKNDSTSGENLSREGQRINGDLARLLEEFDWGLDSNTNELDGFASDDPLGNLGEELNGLFD